MMSNVTNFENREKTETDREEVTTVGDSHGVEDVSTNITKKAESGETCLSKNDANTEVHHLNERIEGNTTRTKTHTPTAPSDVPKDTENTQSENEKNLPIDVPSKTPSENSKIGTVEKEAADWGQTELLEQAHKYAQAVQAGSQEELQQWSSLADDYQQRLQLVVRVHLEAREAQLRGRRVLGGRHRRARPPPVSPFARHPSRTIMDALALDWDVLGQPMKDVHPGTGLGEAALLRNVDAADSTGERCANYGGATVAPLARSSTRK